MSATTPSARRRAASRSGFAIVAIVLAAVLFFAVNILANASLSGVRADLTQGKIYTLSPGTRAILARIDQPLLLRFYVSSKLAREAPSYAAYATRIREFLREYQDASHGMIQVRMVDPQPFSRQEDQAVADGLLVGRVDVLRIAQIDRNRQADVRQILRHLRLRGGLISSIIAEKPRRSRCSPFPPTLFGIERDRC